MGLKFGEGSRFTDSYCGINFQDVMRPCMDLMRLKNGGCVGLQYDRTLFETLRRLQLMQLSLEMLPATGIGKAVNGLRTHSSQQIADLAWILDEYLESFYTLRKPVSSTISTLAGALSEVFSTSTDQAMIEMRQACFDYLSLGGVFSTGPVAILSGINPRLLSLIAHFFAVAIYGVGRLLLPFPSPKRAWIGARLIWVPHLLFFP